jgi:hypothetical protein
MERFANNADSTLNGAINNSTTTIIVADGSSFPSIGDFRLLLGSDADTGEIVLATARSGNTITVVRGQESTSAQSWTDGTTVTHILTAGATESLRDTLKGKTLNSSLETVGSPQDGYALTWINGDGYWAARPGSPFTISGNELNSTRSLSIDSAGSFASTHGDGSAKLYVNGTILASKFSSGEIPLTVQRFGYLSDAFQTFTIPANVTSVQIKMWGPGGGSGNYSGSGGAGPGGFSTGILSVTPGETLYIAVGSGGKKPVSSTGNGGLGGWPGGGFGTRGDASGGGGGGLSGIFSTNTLSQANVLMIAGGGGGSTGFGNFGAGGGGGLTGGSGTSGSGTGGTQSAGGSVGGAALAGGTAFTDNTTSQSNDCGGGGSGYFGGGAGQGDGRAGGGGSGFLHATRISNGVTTTGSNAAAGSGSNSPPSITDPYYVAGTGVGAAASGTGNDGGDGYVVIIYGGQTSIDQTSITLNNGASFTTSNLDVVAKSDGYIKLQATTNIYGQVGSDLITLSSATSGVKLDVNSVAVGRIYQSGAWSIGDATNNDTSSEAQAGLTGSLINLSSGSGSFTSTTNQALIFNQSGALNLQGNTEVRFNTSTSLKGYFDSNGIFRIGPSAASQATLQGGTVPFVGSDYFYMYNSGGSSWAEIIAGTTNTRAALQVMNSGAGGSSTVGVSLFAGGTAHGTTEYAGNGIIEQVGASTSGLIFTKVQGNATNFASTGAIWQSGAWTIGRATNNDTSSEAQAGLTGPLLNITQTTGGSLTTVANQALLYNISGTATLQGNIGHNLIAGTTSVASTSTSKLITSVGRRVATNVRTASYLITASDHVIIVGTLSSSITITLPASPTAGDTYIIKDQAGGSATNNIIVSGNGVNIDGASTYTMNTNYESITVIFANGTWSII